MLLAKTGLEAFRYFDKGNMAVVGKGYAILQSGKFRMHGLTAWLAWASIHIAFLAQLGLRISVFLQWAWLLLTGERGSRLIVNHHPSASTQAGRAVTAQDVHASQPLRPAAVAGK